MKLIKFFICIMITAFIFVLASCGNDEKNAIDPSGTNNQTEIIDGTSIVIIDGEKLIVKYNYNFKSKNIMNMITNFSAKANELNGFIEKSSMSKEKAKYIYRIPKTNRSEFELYLDSRDELTGKDSETVNLTPKYNYNSIKIEALKEMRAELQNEYDTNESLSTSDKIKIREKIMDIDVTLATYETQQSSIDVNSEYNTFVINVIKTTKSPSTFEKFGDYLKNFAIRLLYAIPYLAVGGGICVGVLFVKEKYGKNKKNKENNNNNATE